MFNEWWEVTANNQTFKCTNERDAYWLCDILNNLK